jgi:hypothetical protein
MTERNVRIEEVHEKKTTVRLDKDQLRDLILDALGFRHQRAGVDAKISFEEQTEGSPAYRVGMKATVVVTEDLRPQAIAEPRAA